jgi:diguanylate cyclase (GGDEF)-like protein/PAS domain S-box-containing protein
MDRVTRPVFTYNFRFKVLIFIAVTLISSMPVALLAYWVQSSAMDKEVSGVEEKHLIIAGDLSRAFERYIIDTKAIFAHVSANFDLIDRLQGIDKLLNSTGITDLCIIESTGKISPVLKKEQPCSFTLSNTQIEHLVQKTLDKPNETSMSDLERFNDQPMFFLVHPIGDNRLAVACLETDYIIKIQKSITFGDYGHSMVVDALGQVIAHPDPDWQATSKNASELSIVQKMMHGETGVSTFYSPPMQAEMIAGYTSVPGIGWGVMVPQPFDELRNRADDVFMAALPISIAGFILAVLLGWISARALARPIEAISKTAAAIASGDIQARVNNIPKHTALEVKELALSFNRMVNQLSESHYDLKLHRDDLERLISERTGELEQEILKREHAETVLQQQKERLDITLASIAEGVISTENGQKIHYLNPVAEQLSGWSLKAAYGRTLAEILPIIDTQTGQTIEILPYTGSNTPQTYEGLLLRQDGSTIVVQTSVAEIKGSSGELVIVIRDITETLKLSRQLSFDASHDALTGLLNRREFENLVASAIEQVGSEQFVHCLCYLDLDQFKIINDASGHAAGDQLLCAVSNTLKAFMGKSEVVGRLGGDEFGILLKQCSLSEALKKAEKICKLIRNMRFVYEEQSFHVGVSIGIAEINNQRDTVIGLFKAADSACFLAKKQGRNRAYAYQASDEEALGRAGAVRWVGKLHSALEDDLFELYAQPIASLANELITSHHYELLLRMREEDGTLISPDSFLPAAASYNLLQNIDRWVFIRAIDWLNHHQSLLKGGRLSINITGATLSDTKFLQFAQQQLRDKNMHADAIIIEITENSALSNRSAALTFMSEMRSIGCQFALDDFGKGFSSLSCLKQLPIDYIKIDGGFVQNILTDPVDEIMVKTIRTIGHSIGKMVIAEFVESDEIRSRLRALKIDYGQGFAIGKPSPLSGLAEKLTQEKYVIAL